MGEYTTARHDRNSVSIAFHGTAGQNATTMAFHLGKPILAMMIMAMLSGAVILTRRQQRSTDLVVWIFADSHAKSYRDAVETRLAEVAGAGKRRLAVASAGGFRVGDRIEIDGGSVSEAGVLAWVSADAAKPWLELKEVLKSAHAKEAVVRVPSLLELHQRQTGLSSQINVISTRALDVRLISLFNSRSRDVPDLVEVEIGSVGKYFRPPLDEVGFLPLNKFVDRDGILDQMVRTRFAPWSKQGVIFGMPHDLHPVTITYRKDLFDEAGINIASAKTWDEFQDLCLRFQEYWRRRGGSERRGARYAIELPQAASDYLVTMLLQRRINIIDDYNRVHLNHPKVADTLVHYAQMVAGPRRIAADATPGGDLWARDLARGDLCATITPDWRAGFLYVRAADIAGKVAMMPLPKFEAEDAPTSTWGGTMMGIPRTARDPEASWALLKRLYMSAESLNARQRINKILPPVREQWKDPVFHQGDPFFGGQKVDELYIELAEQIPPRYVTPLTPVGSQSLALVLADAVAYVRNHATEPREKLEAGLRGACQKWLDREAEDLRKRIDFGRFE